MSRYRTPICSCSSIVKFCVLHIGLKRTYFVALSCVPGMFMAVIGRSEQRELIQFAPFILSISLIVL